jgi:hypothetical protein
MKLGALKQLQAASPSLYDPIAIDIACIKALGFSNPQQFMAPPSAMGNPPPELTKMQQDGQAKLQEAQAKTTIAQAKAAEVKAKMEIEQAKIQVEASKGNGKDGSMPIEAAKAKAALISAQARMKEADVKHADAALNAHNLAADRASKEHLATMDLAKDVLLHHSEKAADRERMAFDGAHKSADRDAQMGTEQARIDAMSQAKAKEDKP